MARTNDDLRSALASALPGDEIRFPDGTVLTGDFVATNSGSPAHPMVLRADPTVTNPHATIVGSLVLEYSVSDVWLWGLDVTNSDAHAKNPCIQLHGARDHVINSYIHDCHGEALTAWEQNGDFPGQVVYGNVIARGDHNVYVQNDYDAEGYKYFVQNAVLDAYGSPEPHRSTCCYLFHGYTQGGYNSGINVQDSVFNGGRWLIGGTNNHTRHTVLERSLFYAVNPALSYTTPSQVDSVTGNWFFRSGLSIGFLLIQPGIPNVIRDNEYYGEGFENLRPTSSTGAAVEWNGEQVLDGDKFATDTPATMHSSWWFVRSQQDCCKEFSLERFRQHASATGCTSCEARASMVPTPTTPKIFVRANEYEPGRGLLAIVNWNAMGLHHVPVDLSSVIRTDATFSIVRAAQGPWATPVVAGVYHGGNVDVPVTSEFDVFIILSH